MFTKICDHCFKTVVGDCYETYASFVQHDLHFCNDFCLHEWIKTKLGDTSQLLRFDREYQTLAAELPASQADVILLKKTLAAGFIINAVASKINSPVLKPGAEEPKVIFSHKPFQGAWLFLIRFDVNMNNYESSK